MREKGRRRKRKTERERETCVKCRAIPTLIILQTEHLAKTRGESFPEQWHPSQPKLATFLPRHVFVQPTKSETAFAFSFQSLS